MLARRAGDEAALDDLGVSSVTRVELMVSLERRFDVQLSTRSSSSAATVGELVRIVDGTVGAGS